MFEARDGDTGARCDISLKVAVKTLEEIADVVLVSWLVISGMFDTLPSVSIVGFGHVIGSRATK